MLSKILFLLPHLFSWFYNTTQSSEILIFQIEMLPEFQNEMNIVIIRY